MSRNTVRRYLRDEAAARYKGRPPRPGKLDPFQGLRGGAPRGCGAGADPVQRAARRVARAGLCGRLHDAQGVRRKPRAGARPAAGGALRDGAGRADAGRLGGDAARGRPALGVRGNLGWSRAAYLEFRDRRAPRDADRRPRERLPAFGGVPREVLYDNMRTVVVERNAYGRARHRFQAMPASWTLPAIAASGPRLCQPGRAQTKGKVERFIRYLRGSFYVPLASRLGQEGLVLDREAANLAAGRWLRTVANQRVHATTGAVPAERLEVERTQLQPVPPPYGGRSVRQIQAPAVPAPAHPVVGLQHPLALYDGLSGLMTGEPA